MQPWLPWHVILFHLTLNGAAEPLPSLVLRLSELCEVTKIFVLKTDTLKAKSLKTPLALVTKRIRKSCSPFMKDTGKPSKEMESVRPNPKTHDLNVILKQIATAVVLVNLRD